MGAITRAIFKGTIGEHVYVRVGEDVPSDADVYILECFKARYEYFRDFKRPNAKAKIVSLVHSTAPCVPCTASNRIVTLTHASAYELRTRTGWPSKVIEGGIDMTAYDPLTPDYSARVLTRITRNASGKFHPLWDTALEALLNAHPDLKCNFIVDSAADLLKHPRVGYTTGVKIDDDEAKAEYLSKASMAVIANGDFEETFSMGLLECMAAGLLVVYLYQPALYEVAGPDQVCADSMDDLYDCVDRLIGDERLKTHLGANARERAHDLSSARMVRRWDELLESLA
jgi:glycosyltransferase involved in cell wall biosynthesis